MYDNIDNILCNSRKQYLWLWQIVITQHGDLFVSPLPLLTDICYIGETEYILQPYYINQDRKIWVWKKWSL